MASVLIVEDSLTDRELLSRYLRQAGMAVTSAQSSEEALRLLQTSKPDLIVLDVVLPGQSGFEFCHDLKTTKTTRNIPIVICSTKSTEADKLWGSMLGAEAYLTKPIDPEQLIETVARLCSSSTPLR